MKKYIFIVLFCVLASYVIGVGASDIRLKIDGHEITGLPAAPVIRDDSVLVPARAVFERMGGTVGWDEGRRQVTVNHGNDVLIMTIDNEIAEFNGVAMRMPTAPIILHDSTMIPLRFPGEVFGFGVYWDIANRAAVLYSPEDIPLPPPLVDLPSAEFPPIQEFPYGDPQQEAQPALPPPPPLLGNQQQPQESPTLVLPPDNSLISDEHVFAPPTIVPNGTGLARNISTSPITAANYPQTNITQILSPTEAGSAAYVIVASSAISNVSYFVLSDNRLVLDIYNAANMVDGNVAVHHSVPVSAARVAQFSNVPMVTRIVFDITMAADFSLSLSASRDRLTVAFVANTITSVNMFTDGSSDTLVIQGNILPYIRVSTEGFPRYFTVNIDNATLAANFAGSINGVFAASFVSGHKHNGAAYVRIYIGDEWPTFGITNEQNAVSLTFHRNVSGIRYDSGRRELHISRSTGFSMDISQVHHVNEYLHLRYMITLPSVAGMLGRGEISVMDGYINSITIGQDASGNARFEFDTNRILAFTVHETADSYIIRANLPRDVHPFIVVIDPGHGGWNEGTAHNGLVERHLVLTISEKVMQLIAANPSIQGYRTRWDDSGVYNHMRAEFANELRADLLVSIHANAAGTNDAPNPQPNGIETWYNLGERETTARNRFNSRQFAEIVQRHMVARTGVNNRGTRYGADMVVLRESNVPSVLVEIGFLTNPAEAARLASSQYQWLLAHAIYDAIVEAASMFPR